MRFLRDDSGLSLTELLVVSVLILVILSAAYVLFGAGTSITNTMIARSDASFDGQKGIDKISLDLRQSQPREYDEGNIGVIENATLVSANSNELWIATDADADAKPELVHYYSEVGADGVRALKRAVKPHDEPSAMEPFTFNNFAYGAPTTVVKSLADLPVFCFHNNTTVATPTATCGLSPRHGFGQVTGSNGGNSFPTVSLVGIQLKARGKSGDKTIDVYSRALVRVRTAAGNRVD
jgi:prepilin-type N-terminal cleavage/methylation domain-containing protein